MRGVLLATVAALTAPFAAQAAINVTYSGYGADNGGFMGPSGPGALITFDGDLPAGYTLTGANGFAIQSGNNGNGAAPALSASTFDTTKYLSVYGPTGNAVEATVSILGTAAFNTASFYWGSVDTYNGFYLLNAAGSRISPLLNNTSITPASPGNGNQTAVNTNGRVNIQSDTNFYGIEFVNQRVGNQSIPAFEIDNLKFLNSAVPDAATWGMMVLGFGLVGGLARRSSKPRVAFG